MLKASARNCAENRSPNLKVLAIDKSQLRKPVSRKMLRPMVPNVPAVGGTMTELPFAKQPNAARVPGSGALATQLPQKAADCVADNGIEPTKGMVWVQPPAPGPVQYGIELAPPDLKSENLPKKSQRSVPSLVPLMLLAESKVCHGCALWRVTMELIFQPSKSCANPFLPGMLYVTERVNRCRMSKSLFPY